MGSGNGALAIGASGRLRYYGPASDFATAFTKQLADSFDNNDRRAQPTAN